MVSYRRSIMTMEDLFLKSFLSFLEQDLIKNPEKLSFVIKEEKDRIVDITDGVKVSDFDIIPEDITL